MKIRHLLAILLLSAILLPSCKNAKSTKIYMPSVSGKAGDVLVVINKPLWENEIGTELRSILAAEYPFLNQTEPMFTLYNVSHDSFGGGFLAHRNIVVVNVGESFDTSKVVYQEDVWAAPQLVVTVSAPSKEAALEIIKTDKSRIMNALEQAERNRIIKNSRKYEEIPLRDAVSESFGGSPYFPKGYTMKKNTPDFVWISYETTYVNQGIFIYRYPYTGKPFTVESIIAKRDEVLHANVPGMTENSFMTTSRMVEPGLQWVQYKKRDFVEVRGLWEVENDFMGGPFVCHSILSPDNSEVIVLEGFVYAPRFDKRNYLRHVESIIYSFEWNN